MATSAGLSGRRRRVVRPGGCRRGPRESGHQVGGHGVGRGVRGRLRRRRRHGAVDGQVILGGLVQGGLHDGRHARVGVPERGAAAQHVEARVPYGRVGRRAARQDGPHAAGRLFAVLHAACHHGHHLNVVVRVRALTVQTQCSIKPSLSGRVPQTGIIDFKT